ncbi:TraX family protein [Romeria aff. gracilis LEGE 07310]|uniref:TraX family protein n=1 Tax=Vasconcelosia minhoensis LEGE 07310 TaxID=915328 RepID=A0A8J7AR86_9CYAN|nr:TraX family protein [Romeria gracilis]MBE9078976.1 TraX family protein [Romeria aff. gracilis LEGE 07310]
MTGLTSYHLKLIAALTMLVDHIGVVFYPDLVWLRMIGRVSFPLFVWLLVQGEAHTKNIGRYGLRLGLLGLVSQPVYQMVFDTAQLNILFQLLIGLVCLRAARQRPELMPPVWITGALIAEALPISYGGYGIILILLTRYFRPNLPWWLAWVSFHLIWTGIAGPFQLPAIGAPLLFMAFNGQRGPQARWFYGFYPGHLALLTLLRG